jgi:hypothetical protein
LGGSRCETTYTRLGCRSALDAEDPKASCNKYRGNRQTNLGLADCWQRKIVAVSLARVWLPLSEWIVGDSDNSPKHTREVCTTAGRLLPTSHPAPRDHIRRVRDLGAIWNSPGDRHVAWRDQE